MISTIELVFFGDIILDVPNPNHWLSGIAPIARAADLAVAHLEVPHTRRGEELQGDVPAPGADPDHLAALAAAGIRAVSLAGNHITDCGAIGIADTVAELDRLGIAHAGAGATLSEASRPAFIACGGRRIALLSYNCVGPEIGWATATRAGSAYVRIMADDGGPTRPQAALTFIDPDSQAAMAEAIAAAAGVADFVVVALHKGITHRPAELAPYERPLAHAALEAGAHVVVGHHAHIARGIEFHRGRPIFHGLGNGTVVTHALGPDQTHPARAEWAARRKAMFGFEPDPRYPLAPFHPEAVNGMAAHVRLRGDGGIEAGFIPLWSEPPGRLVRAEGPRGQEVADYIDAIGRMAALPALHRQWVEDRVVLS